MCHVTPRLSALKHGTPRTHTSHTLTHAPRLSYCVQQEGRELSCTCPPSSASRQRLTKEGWKALDLVQLDRRLLGWGVLCGAITTLMPVQQQLLLIDQRAAGLLSL